MTTVKLFPSTVKNKRNTFSLPNNTFETWKDLKLSCDQEIHARGLVLLVVVNNLEQPLRLIVRGGVWKH